MNTRYIPRGLSLSSALFQSPFYTLSGRGYARRNFYGQGDHHRIKRGEQLTRATTGTGLGPVLIHDFDTSVVADGSYELTAPTTLALSSGRHLVMYATRFDAHAGTNRSEVISNITLAGTQLAAGTSQGFQRRLGGADEMVMSGGAIINVAADDDVVTLESRRSDTNTNAATLPTREPNYTSAQFLKLDDSWDYLNLQRTTNQADTVGTGGENVIFESDNSSGTHGTAFSYPAGSADITLNETGLYLVFANTKLEKVALNNAALTTFRHSLSTERKSQVLKPPPIFEAMPMARMPSRVSLRLDVSFPPPQVRFCGSDLPWNPVEWPAPFKEMAPPSLRSNSPSPPNTLRLPTPPTRTSLTLPRPQSVLTPRSPQQIPPLHAGGSTITANNAGDYLFLGSLFTESDTTNDNHDRVVPITRWRQNGSTILDRGQGAAYNRDNGGNRTSGSWNSTLITLAASDTVEMTSENVGTTPDGGGFPNNTPTMQGLEIASLEVSNDPAIAANLPFTVLPSSAGNVITDAFLDTFDNDTALRALTYTVDTAPIGGNLKLSGATLGMGGAFTQEDIDNSLVTFDAGAAAPVVGGFDFTVSDGGASDSSTFVINVEWPVTTVSISGNGDVTEGGNVDLDFTSDVAPVGANLTVTIAYSGSADGTDFTGATTVDILDGATSATINVSPIADGLFEGAESVTATITDVSGPTITGAIGTASATFFINDGANTAPNATNLTQVIAGAGTVSIGDIVVTDPDTSYDSEVTGAGTPLFWTNGIANRTVFSDGRTDDDTSFDVDAGGPTLNAVAGFSIDIAFTPQADDLTGVVDVWEIGGSSNGSVILLIEGVPHLLSKAGGGPADAPTDDESVSGAFTDLDWATDDTIVVPLDGATVLTAGAPARLAVVYDITGNSVKSSVNGSAEATATLINFDANNWRGDHTVNTGTGAGSGTGGSSTPTGVALDSTLKNLAGGSGSVSSVRFWNSATGTASGTAGALDDVTATLTIAGWASAANGTLTAESGNGETFVGGVWSVTGDIFTVNAALAAAEFVTGGSTADPTVINVSIDDGDEDAGGPVTGAIIYTATAADPIYVDDNFTGNLGDPIADGDLGDPGAQPATLGLSAFTNLTDALGAVTSTGTIIVNDGDYSTENITLADSVTLQLTDTAGPVQIGDIATGLTNSIDLWVNTLEIGASNASTTGIQSPISGAGGNLTKIGTGLLQIHAPTSHTGTTTILDGRLRIGQNVGIGLQSELGGDGPVVVTSPGRLEFYVGVDNTITQSAAITGTGEVATGQDGTLIFDGPANTFSGGFELGDGTSSTWDGASGAKGGFVVLNHNDHLGSGLVLSRGGQLQTGTTGLVIPNDIDITNGGFRCGGGNDYTLSGQINPIGVSNRGFGNYGLEGLDLTITGNVDTTGGSVIPEGSNGKDNGSWTFDGDITGTLNVLVQTTFDNGEVTFNGNNTYTGTTTMRSGTTNLNGTHTGGGAYLVQDGSAIMTGTGSTTSAVTVNAGTTLRPVEVEPLAPSQPAPSFSTEPSKSTLTTPLALLEPIGTRFAVTGTVTIGGGIAVTESATVEDPPSDIIIISNDDFDAVSGAFASGLPFSSDYLGSGLSGDGGYTGGDGNDIILTPGAESVIGSWRLEKLWLFRKLRKWGNLSDAADSDGLNNFLEFAFGTNPMDGDNADLMRDGTVNGVPITYTDFTGVGVTFDSVFVRREDHGISGSLNYIAQFSADLITWHDSTATPTLVASSTDDDDYEVVSVPYPFFTPDGRKTRFSRVKAEFVK